MAQVWHGLAGGGNGVVMAGKGGRHFRIQGLSCLEAAAEPAIDLFYTPT